MPKTMTSPATMAVHFLLGRFRSSGPSGAPGSSGPPCSSWSSCSTGSQGSGRVGGAYSDSAGIRSSGRVGGIRAKAGGGGDGWDGIGGVAPCSGDSCVAGDGGPPGGHAARGRRGDGPGDAGSCGRGTCPGSRVPPTLTAASHTSLTRLPRKALPNNAPTSTKRCVLGEKANYSERCEVSAQPPDPPFQAPTDSRGTRRPAEAMPHPEPGLSQTLYPYEVT